MLKICFVDLQLVWRWVSDSQAQLKLLGMLEAWIEYLTRICRPMLTMKVRLLIDYRKNWRRWFPDEINLWLNYGHGARQGKKWVQKKKLRKTNPPTFCTRVDTVWHNRGIRRLGGLLGQVDAVIEFNGEDSNIKTAKIKDIGTWPWACCCPQKLNCSWGREESTEGRRRAASSRNESHGIKYLFTPWRSTGNC